MNASELKDALKGVIKDLGWRVKDFAGNYTDVGDMGEINGYQDSDPEYFKVAKQLCLAVGPFKMVHDERCGSDMDVYTYVYHFKEHDIYLAIDGSYSSWDGVDFYGEDWYEVKPKQVTTTIYEMVR